MRPITLVLIIHDHQPIGNFDGVFEHAHAAAYLPFLAFLESHPALRLALHTSGPLLQWLALHQSDYLSRLRVLAERGQVELWGGGFFEPILPAIPEADRRGQIRAMADWLELELGRRPRGLWLAERVWEPTLASSLWAAGMEYTALDDAHFVAAGLEREALWGTYETEDQGHAIRVFPIHRELRYLIPFEPPARTVEFLSRLSEGGEDRIAVLGDDGEKFGVWPGTHKLCYEEGWLEQWAGLLAENPWIQIRTPAEAIAHHPSLGLAYLPSAAYHEMQEWALPPTSRTRYHRAAERLEPEFHDGARDLLRGGHWRTFLARYPESNRMHKRMLRASRRIWQQPDEKDPVWKEARTHLWRAQCNCAYWHGVFGGLYLPHLRSAVYRDLIAAETYLVPPSTLRIEHGDIDLDGVADVLLEDDTGAVWVSARGGRVWGLDDRVGCINYADTLARRREVYHQQLEEAVVGAAEGHTIHGQTRLKEPGLAALLQYDDRGRDLFLDRWTEAGRTHDWALDRFGLDQDLVAGVGLVQAEADAPEIRKRISRLPDGTVEVAYALSSTRARQGTLEVEVNLGFHVARADDRFVVLNGQRADPPHFGAAALHGDVQSLEFADLWLGRRLEIRCDPTWSVSRAPIETVSLSEAGVERVFQGIELGFSAAVRIEPARPFHALFRLASSST